MVCPEVCQIRHQDQHPAMSGARKVLVAIAAAGLIGLTALAVQFVTGPALPAGATRLQIATGRPNLTFGCPAALLAPASVATLGDELILVSIDTGAPVPVVWPSGFAAWRVDGRAVVATWWGGVVGREGGVLDSLGGGTDVDGVFHVCRLGIPTKG
jgi:hypothetical protein